MADSSTHHDVLPSSSEMVEVSCAEDDLMNTTTTFLVQDDGGEYRYAYLVQLDGSEAAAEGGDGSATLAMAYYQQPTSLCLDDEQASAAANLLEFNQQVYILPDHATAAEHHLQFTPHTPITAEEIINQPVQISQSEPETHLVHQVQVPQFPKVIKTYGKKSAPSQPETGAVGLHNEITTPVEQHSSKPAESEGADELATVEVANQPEIDVKPNIFSLSKGNGNKIVPKPMKTYSKKSSAVPVSAVKIENPRIQPLSRPSPPVEQPPPPPPPPPNTSFRRKRKLLVDTIKVIPHAEFRKQLTEPVTTNTDVPPSKKSRILHHPSTVGRFFAYPGRKIGSSRLSQLFFSHLRIRVEIPAVAVPYPGGMLQPLDPELRTSDVTLSTTLDCPFGTPFSSYLAQQRAESFDVLVKGMGKNRGYYYRKPAKKPSFYSTIKREVPYLPHDVKVEVGPLLVCKREAGTDPLLDTLDAVNAEGELIISDLHDGAQDNFIYATETPGEGEIVYYTQHEENGTEANHEQEQECVIEASSDPERDVNVKAYHTDAEPTPTLFMD